MIRWLCLLMLALSFTSLFGGLIGTDSVLYATISKTMAVSGDWMNLYFRGEDWLDKPHLQFWASALFFKVFGIKAWVFKLPALLVWLGGCLYTYLFATKLYNERVGEMALLIALTPLHAIISNYDVRAEGYLMAFSIASFYHLYMVYKTRKWNQVFFAAAFAAMAIMTKGIFALIAIGSGIFIYLIISGGLRRFLDPRWWVFGLLTFVFITPELLSLYQQFDLHPEKTVFGRNNVSGLSFFFWDSQFGRFFNTGPIKGKGDLFFFFHTTLWAFLPWSPLLVSGIISLFRQRQRRGVKRHEEIMIYGSALVSFLIFSLSSFQLPHYILLLFPHFSIITARFIFNMYRTRAINGWYYFYIILLLVLMGVFTAVDMVAFFPGGIFSIVVLSILALAAIVFSRSLHLYKNRILLLCTAFSVSCIFFFYGYFYPALQPYQAGREAGLALKEKGLTDSSYMYPASYRYAFDFYAPAGVNSRDSGFGTHSKPPALFISSKDLQSLPNMDLLPAERLEFYDFRVTKLNMKFLNHKTRPSQLDTFYLYLPHPSVHELHK